MDESAPIFLEQDSCAGMIYSGGWGRAQGGVHDVTAPADGSLVGSVGKGNAADVAKAAAAAAAAQPAWEATPAAERARILTAAADALVRHGDELMPWIIRETGSIPPRWA